MKDYYTKEDRKDAIRISLTRKLKTSGLHEFINKAVDHAQHAFDTGMSAFSAIQAGVKYGHELEKRYLGEDEHADNHGIGAGL